MYGPDVVVGPPGDLLHPVGPIAQTYPLNCVYQQGVAGSDG